MSVKFCKSDRLLAVMISNVDSKTFNPALESLRGIAAMAVVITHASAVLLVDGSAAYWSTPILDQTPTALIFTLITAILNPGGAVILFFILSGYVLSISLNRDSNLLPYLVRRLFRLLPVMWVSIICLSIVFWTISLPKINVSDWYIAVTNQEHTLFAVLKNCILHSFPVNGVTWTMYVELIGSILLLVSIYISKKFGLRGSAALLVIYTVLAYFYFPNLTVSYLMCFQCGVILREIKSKRFKHKYLLLCTGFMLFFLERTVIHGNIEGHFINTLASFFIVGSVLHGAGENLLKNPWLKYIGKISYSLYLFHMLVLMVVGYLMVKLELQNSGAFSHIIVFLTAIPSSIFLAALSYHFIEVPTLKWGRSISIELTKRKTKQKGAASISL